MRTNIYEKRKMKYYDSDIEFTVADRPDGKADIAISGTIEYDTLRRLVMLLSPKKVTRIEL